MDGGRLEEMPNPTKRDSVFSAAGVALTDQFFRSHDEVLLDRMRKTRRSTEMKAVLAEVAGIRDDHVLQKLVDLEVGPETVAAIALVPLVEMAWADGTLDAKERQAVLAAADAQGIVSGSVESALLASWLSQRPEPKLIEAWQHYVRGLCGMMDEAERQGLKRDILERARTVATASGGFLGIGKISDAEQEMLEKLEATFASSSPPSE
jgi:hypothetical protein